MNPRDLHPEPRRPKRMNTWNSMMPVTQETKMPKLGQWVLLYDGQAIRTGQWILVDSNSAAFVNEDREIMCRNFTHWAALPDAPSM